MAPWFSLRIAFGTTTRQQRVSFNVSTRKASPMPNTNPRAKKVVNEHMRPNSDRMVGLITEAIGLATMSQAQGTGDLFPADTEVIEGSDSDGRVAITNADALATLQAMREFIAWSQTPSQVTGKTPLAAFAKLAVNPR